MEEARKTHVRIGDHGHVGVELVERLDRLRGAWWPGNRLNRADALRLDELGACEKLSVGLLGLQQGQWQRTCRDGALDDFGNVLDDHAHVSEPHVRDLVARLVLDILVLTAMALARRQLVSEVVLVPTTHMDELDEALATRKVGGHLRSVLVAVHYIVDRVAAPAKASVSQRRF